MESGVVRNKEIVKNRKRDRKSSFNDLPKEIHTKIFNELYGKSVSLSMCVSHTWRDTILDTTLPKMQQRNVLSVSLFTHPFLYLKDLFQWFSKVMHWRVSPKSMINSCNGLLLFCHKDGEAQNLRRGAYHFYVINHATKQCLAILKPTRTFSVGYSYAALAYDPFESWFFKIMRFLDRRHVSVFFSRSGQWTTLTLNLPQEVIKAHWIKKSVYRNGAIYRLSRSGHVIKFMVDSQETIDEQALAIPLPPACLLKTCHWDIQVRWRKLLFSMSLGAYFFVFELLENVERGVISYIWKKICSIHDQNLRVLNLDGKLLSYHPHHGLAIFKHKVSFYSYRTNGNASYNIYANSGGVGPHLLPSNGMLYDYLKNCGLLLLKCSINFSCTLNRENQRVFQWLPIPE